MLLASPAARAVTISRGDFEQIYPKPTTLLCLRLPQIKALQLICAKFSKPPPLKRGRAEQGWHSAPLKKFPLHVTAVLAHSCWQAASGTLDPAFSSEDDAVQQVLLEYAGQLGQKVQSSPDLTDHQFLVPDDLFALSTWTEAGQMGQDFAFH